MTAGPLLMTPGPVPLSGRVATALRHAVESHHDPDFYAVLDEARKLIASLVAGDGLVAVLPGSGRVGLEAAISTTVGPGDRTLHLVNGFFGRWTVTMAERAGASADVLEGPTDRGFAPERAAEAVAAAARTGRPYRLLTVTQCETSTAQLTAVDQLVAALPDDARPLVLVDAISSVPGVPLALAPSGPDLCVLGSQKALGAPMGLAVVAAGSRALTGWEQADWTPATWAFDLRRWTRFDAVETQRPYPVVPSTHLVRALHAALLELEDEDPLDRARRLEAVAHRTRTAVRAGGLDVHGLDPSPTVTPVALPDGIRATDVSRLALDHDAVRVVGGMGEVRERIVRIPHLGVQARASWQRRTVAAVLRACGRLGATTDVEAGLAAFDELAGIPDPPLSPPEGPHGR